MLTYFRPAFVLLVIFTVLTGIAYPLAMTGLAQGLFPLQANGSLIEVGGGVIGSELIGQRFVSDRYFHSRPSAAGEKGYDAASSSGSNLGPLSKTLLDRVKGEVAKLRRDGASVIPGDAVTTSGSGLDPDISPAFAELQVARVAKARGVTDERVRALVVESTAHPAIGLIGEPRVNVLLLNIALDRSFGAASG
ncbi:MAG: potassium-transporting ATPase subunit KdpC [Hyphomicrobium sp.]|uniref:potassium-transporting ATPase subunit KdpC n=1 Tax=Hyphomicrobium sp. TaxID=82 RepID=UPI0039E2267D